MSNNPKSILLLFVLIAAVLFLGGVRLGKHVERLDKSYIPPTPFPSPTPFIEVSPTTRPLAFIVYKNQFCGISFLYPDYLKIKSASDEAEIQQTGESIAISCNPNKVKETQEIIKNLADPESRVTRGKTVALYKISKGKTVWVMQSPGNNKKITMEASDELVNLILKTLDRN